MFSRGAKILLVVFLLGGLLASSLFATYVSADTYATINLAEIQQPVLLAYLRRSPAGDIQTVFLIAQPENTTGTWTAPSVVWKADCSYFSVTAYNYGTVFGSPAHCETENGITTALLFVLPGDHVGGGEAAYIISPSGAQYSSPRARWIWLQPEGSTSDNVDTDELSLNVEMYLQYADAVLFAGENKLLVFFSPAIAATETPHYLQLIEDYVAKISNQKIYIYTKDGTYKTELPLEHPSTDVYYVAFDFVDSNWDPVVGTGYWSSFLSRANTYNLRYFSDCSGSWEEKTISRGTTIGSWSYFRLQDGANVGGGAKCSFQVPVEYVGAVFVLSLLPPWEQSQIPISNCDDGLCGYEPNTTGESEAGTSTNSTNTSILEGGTTTGSTTLICQLGGWVYNLVKFLATPWELLTQLFGQVTRYIQQGTDLIAQSLAALGELPSILATMIGFFIAILLLYSLVALIQVIAPVVESTVNVLMRAPILVVLLVVAIALSGIAAALGAPINQTFSQCGFGVQVQTNAPAGTGSTPGGGDAGGGGSSGW